ncbi:MAG: histidine kinase [Candidatus Eremiobacteraeota bacterium]|nr:histidine kinase [Candidatus Eremiobacteraeota bacterium]
MKRLWILLWWLALALFDATRTVEVMRSEGMQHNWPVLFVIEALEWLPWAAATWAAIALTHRLRSASRALTWSAYVAAAIAANTAFAAWTTFLVVAFRPFGPDFPHYAVPHFLSGFTDGLLTTIVFFALILTTNHFFESRERLAKQNMQLAQLNAKLAQAQLSTLRHQIEPHFLFNALNSIAGLIRENKPNEAINTLVSLSDFLRRTLSESNRQEVALSEELDFVKEYLATQKVRFAERLQLSVDVPTELQNATVPNLILQPLVENAIKHGIAKRKEGGSVRIAATSQENRLSISIANDGPPLAPDWEGGVGITNVRARLQALYGDAASLALSTRTLGGVEVALTVPLRTAAT